MEQDFVQSKTAALRADEHPMSHANLVKFGQRPRLSLCGSVLKKTQKPTTKPTEKLAKS